MEAEGSLPCSQEPASGLYRESDESSQHPPGLFFLRYILMLSFQLPLGLLVVWLSYQKRVFTYILSHAFYTLHLPNRP
jgi:hypothetical protein